MIDTLKAQVKRIVGGRLLRDNRRSLADSGVLTHDRLHPSLWGCDVDEAGRMHAAGIPLEDVAKRFGTPVHVIDVARLEANMRGFLDAFSGSSARVRLGTSYKTNPVPYVLRKLHSWGTLAEVISPFELWLATELGMRGEHIIFNGPGKTIPSLERAVEHGVWLVNLDSLEEMHDLERVCAARQHTQDVGIRVTTGVGWSSQFGLPINDGSAFEAFRKAHDSEHLNPIGIHLHLGTGLSDIGTYVQGITEVVDLARRVHRELGIQVSVLDLGGGFGVPTTGAITEWDHRLQHMGQPVRTAIPHATPVPGAYADQIVPIVDQYFSDVGLVDGAAEIIFEPGRAITASAQMLLLSVMRIKRGGRGTPDVILDGGKNVCVPLAWEFHEIQPVGRMSDPEVAMTNLYGPLCHPHDIIAQHKVMPRLDVGDVVAVMDTGAYFIPSQCNFSNPRPGVVAIENGTAKLVREPETYEDIIRLDRASARSDAGVPA